MIEKSVEKSLVHDALHYRILHLHCTHTYSPRTCTPLSIVSLLNGISNAPANRFLLRAHKLIYHERNETSV